jgi:hypothetical protein
MAADEIPEGMRKCPFCAEIIRSEAKICRFCQRDLPAEPTEDSSAAGGSDAVEPRALRYGDHVSSPIMGNGMVVSAEPDGDSVLVSFERDHKFQRAVAKSELHLIANPAPSTTGAVPSSSPDDTLIGAAWATAFLLPLIGFICGVILVAKGQVGHGVGSMIASLLMSLIWVAILLGAFA